MYMMVLGIFSCLRHLFGETFFYFSVYVAFLPPNAPSEGHSSMGQWRTVRFAGCRLIFSLLWPPSLGSHYPSSFLSLIYISPVDNRDTVYSTWVNHDRAVNLFPLEEWEDHFHMIDLIGHQHLNGWSWRWGPCLDSTVLFLSLNTGRHGKESIVTSPRTDGEE